MSTIQQPKWLGKTHDRLSADEWSTIKGANIELYHRLVQDSIPKPEPEPAPKPAPVVVPEYVTSDELRSAQRGLIKGITGAIAAELKKQIARITNLETKTTTMADASRVAETDARVTALNVKVEKLLQTCSSQGKALGNLERKFGSCVLSASLRD